MIPFLIQTIFVMKFPRLLCIEIKILEMKLFAGLKCLCMLNKLTATLSNPSLHNIRSNKVYMY